MSSRRLDRYRSRLPTLRSARCPPGKNSAWRDQNPSRRWRSTVRPKRTTGKLDVSDYRDGQIRTGDPLLPKHLEPLRGGSWQSADRPSEVGFEAPERVPIRLRSPCSALLLCHERVTCANLDQPPDPQTLGRAASPRYARRNGHAGLRRVRSQLPPGAGRVLSGESRAREGALLASGRREPRESVRAGRDWVDAGRPDDGTGRVQLCRRRGDWLRDVGVLCHTGHGLHRGGGAVQSEGRGSGRLRLRSVAGDERSSPRRRSLEDCPQARRSNHHVSATGIRDSERSGVVASGIKPIGLGNRDGQIRTWLP
jgi:hypothetical protein